MCASCRGGDRRGSGEPARRPGDGYADGVARGRCSDPAGAGDDAGDSTFVFIIEEPGSYYLDENIRVGAGQYGVYIRSEQVTLDLNGYSIIGDENSIIGVLSQTTLGGITVRNGFVESMGSAGIFNDSGEMVVEDMTVRDCGDDGIYVGVGRVERCYVEGNAGDGIEMFGPGIVRDSIARQNQTGIRAQGIVDGCDVRENTGDGVVLLDGVCQDTLSVRNGGAGFRVLGTPFFTELSAELHNCSATENQDGFNIGVESDGFLGKAVLHGCSALNNTGVGFQLTVVNGRFQECTALGNGSLGFGLSGDAAVHACVSSENVSGIVSPFNAVDVRGCTTNKNTQNGVVVTDQGSMVVGCVSKFNGNRDYVFNSNRMQYGPIVGGTGVITTAAGGLANIGDLSQDLGL